MSVKTIDDLIKESSGNLSVDIEIDNVHCHLLIFRGIVTVTLFPDESLGLHRGHFEPDEEERSIPVADLLRSYIARLAPV